jgi:23S rRNA pseudouridine1911/1915/1917 synthase
MSSIGHPLLGDAVYGGAGTKFELQCGAIISGQCLHAKELELIHPRTGEKMHFECELPENFGLVLDKLQKHSY